MKIVAIVTIAFLLVIVAALSLAPSRGVETKIEIGTPPARVWAVLADTKNYDKWNPDMRLIGDLSPGATIENIEGAGEDQMIFWPTVLVVRPDQELRWLGHFKVPGLFDGEHYFLLRPTQNGTELTQGEHFHGIALWFYDVNQVVPDFAKVNESLKVRAERS
jgi:hypothetical protein